MAYPVAAKAAMGTVIGSGFAKCRALTMAPPALPMQPVLLKPKV